MRFGPDSFGVSSMYDWMKCNAIIRFSMFTLVVCVLTKKKRNFFPSISIRLESQNFAMACGKYICWKFHQSTDEMLLHVLIGSGVKTSSFPAFSDKNIILTSDSTKPIFCGSFPTLHFFRSSVIFYTVNKPKFQPHFP